MEGRSYSERIFSPSLSTHDRERNPPVAEINLPAGADRERGEMRAGGERRLTPGRSRRRRRRNGGAARGAAGIRAGELIDDVLLLIAADIGELGDLDGDGAEDAVTFLSRSFGGPELYLSLELFLNKNGSPSHTASYVIGDRVAIDSVKIARQRINLFLITQGPDDAICCPTLHICRTLRLQNGKLLELNGL